MHCALRAERIVVNLLAIETSSPVLSVAVKKGKNPARAASLSGYFRHAENLLPLIDRLLRKEKLRIQDVDAFLIGRGPGSFTGLRVGFATLKGLIAVKKKPCYGTFSTDLIAAGIPACKNEKLHVCLDAKRGKLYARSYRSDGRGWKPLKAPSVLSLEVLKKQITAGTLLAGDGFFADKEKTLDTGVLKARWLPRKFWHPRASTLISLFEKKDAMLQLFVKPKDFLPVYIRRSEAEERRGTLPK